MEVQEKETLAMFKAMKWVEQLPFSVVIFESDCKGLVNQVKSRNNSTTEFGVLVDSIGHVLISNPSFYIQFAYCRANFAAHALTRTSLKNPINNYFYAENVSLHGFNSKREVFIVQQFAFSIALNWRILFIISLLVIIVLLCGKRLDYGLGLSHC